MKVFYHFNDAWEREWLENIFVGVELEHIVDVDMRYVEDDSIYVSKLRRNEPRDFEFWRKVKALDNVGLYHAGDERYLSYYEFYNSFNYIIRNYFTARLNGAGIVQVPFFLNASFWSLDGPGCAASSRKYSWWFIGRDNVGGRAGMLKEFETLESGFEVVNRSKAWAKGAVSQEEYIDTLRNSVFCPCCPGSDSADTVRIYEALQCGTIPVCVLKRGYSYYEDFFRDVPFVVASDWKDAVSKIRALLADEDKLNRMQEQCVAWWTAKVKETRDSCQSVSKRGALDGKVRIGRMDPALLRILSILPHADDKLTAFTRRVKMELLRRPLYAKELQ